MWLRINRDARPRELSLGRDRGARQMPALGSPFDRLSIRMERNRDLAYESCASQALPRDGKGMSGYLHRLARSVTQPAGNVHPIVGSVFAAPDRGRANDRVEEDVTAVSPAATAPRREASQ